MISLPSLREQNPNLLSARAKPDRWPTKISARRANWRRFPRDLDPNPVDLPFSIPSAGSVYSPTHGNGQLFAKTVVVLHLPVLHAALMHQPSDFYLVPPLSATIHHLAPL